MSTAPNEDEFIEIVEHSTSFFAVFFGAFAIRSISNKDARRTISQFFFWTAIVIMGCMCKTLENSMEQEEE